MIAIAREFILSRYQLCASNLIFNMGTTRLFFSSEILIFFIFFNILNISFVNLSIIFCQHLDHLHFFQIADPAAAYHYGITTLPTLVYFKNSVPNLFDGEASFSSKRKKSNIMSARQICLSPEKILKVWNYKSEICQNLDEIVGVAASVWYLAADWRTPRPADVRE